MYVHSIGVSVTYIVLWLTKLTIMILQISILNYKYYVLMAEGSIGNFAPPNLNSDKMSKFFFSRPPDPISTKYRTKISFHEGNSNVFNPLHAKKI